MTARIQRSFDLQLGVHFTGEFYINLYEIDLSFDVETESIREQNIALERIKFFLSECLENSILVRDSDTDAIQSYLDANMKVCSLPEQPYDQIVGIMLMIKLNAVTEGRLVITDISIGSRMSDGVSCLISVEDNIGPFATKGWWTEPTTKINNFSSTKSTKKVVKLMKPAADWSDVYLDWEEKDPFPSTSSCSEIVFANFDNKTDK